VLPSQPDVSTVSLLTVGDSVPGNDGDAVPGYQMVGIPDGLGAYDNGNGTFTVLMNHELTGVEGVPRAHGAVGAFVSKWTISKRTLRVLKGEDLIQQVALAPGGVYAAPIKGVIMQRFCSADLPARTALYNPRTGLGYAGRLFLNGEEIAGTEGRAFAHGPDGTSYELPAIGKYAHENVLANPATGNKTVVVSTDDGTGNQVYVYVGDKKNSGNPAERAGLNDGTLYGLKVPTVPAETDLTPPSGAPFSAPFVLANLGDARTKTGLQLETESNAVAVTHWQRPEDGVWDVKHPNDFYFATTASPTNKSRLWRLRFDDVNNPAAGGTIEMLLDGTEGQIMFDNVTVDGDRVLLQEDPGNNPRVAKVWSYSIAADTLTEIAHHDAAHFEAPPPGTTNTGFITQDEESSGIIPLDRILGKGWYLFDSQIHERTFATPQEQAKLVEKGQLLLLHYPTGNRDGRHDDEDDDGGGHEDGD
jgi:hypothetical protein